MSDRKAPTRDFAVDEDEVEWPNLIYYRMAGKKRYAHGTWYRGESTNFHPMRDSLGEKDAIRKYVGHGWFPQRPFITKDHYISAFGSCFAAEVTKFLISEKYKVFGGDLHLDSYVVRAGEGIVSSASMAQQFEWAFGLLEPQSDTWHAKDGSLAAASDHIQAETLKIFQQTDVFILTLGMSEVWHHKRTGEVFWRAIPNQQFDPSEHAFKVLSPAENRAHIERIRELIRVHRPEAHIIITLSPVPLAATFRPVSCVTANAVSKASLRVAIDELMREHANDDRLHYFPSYEIVLNFLDDALGDDLRHPRPETIDTVMQCFKKEYLC